VDNQVKEAQEESLKNCIKSKNSTASFWRNWDKNNKMME